MKFSFQIKRYVIALSALLTMVIGINGQSQSSFSNDICFPSKQYFLDVKQSDMFVQTFLKRWRPFDDYVRFSGTAIYARRYEKVATLKSPKNGQIIKVELINSDSFLVKKTIESTVCVGHAGKGAEQIVVQFLGDSYTKGAYFKSAFFEKGYVPNVKCVGLRKVDGVDNQYHEGRGGWTLEQYFSQNVIDTIFFNPFYQPQSKYRFWGSTAFWLNAIAVNDKTNKTVGFEPRYSCGGYDVSRFDQLGKLAKPQVNDVMFDSKLKLFIVWNGKKWEKTSLNTFHWSFQYDKYLKMWDIQAPDFLVVMLGLNDFRDKDLDTDFTEWNNRIDTLLCSYRQAVPNGKFVLCTPCTSCGRLDNVNGDFTVRQNAVMWEHRKNIIDHFDNREAYGLYVVDAAITIDNDFGYKESAPEHGSEDSLSKPNIFPIQQGNPHPYLSYPSIGIPIAAFIQYYRHM